MAARKISGSLSLSTGEAIALHKALFEYRAMIMNVSPDREPDLYREHLRTDRLLAKLHQRCQGLALRLAERFESAGDDAPFDPLVEAYDAEEARFEAMRARYKPRKVA